MLSTAVSPDGNLFALGFFHFGVQLTYYASGLVVDLIKIELLGKAPLWMEFFSDSKRIAVMYEDKIMGFDIYTHAELFNFPVQAVATARFQIVNDDYLV